MNDQLTLTFSAESGDSPSPLKGSVGEQLHSAKRTTIAERFSKSTGQKSQLLTRSETLKDMNTRDVPLLPEVFHVNASVTAEKNLAAKMTVISGRKCLGLLKKQNPVSLWQKMLLESSIWHSTMCYLTWKPKGTPQGRLLLELAVSMPSTNVKGSGFLPTPTANEDAAGSCQGKMQTMLANHPEVRCQGAGTLNPLFVEWLMGYPTKHTELPHSETQ